MFKRSRWIDCTPFTSNSYVFRKRLPWGLAFKKKKWASKFVNKEIYSHSKNYAASYIFMVFRD